MKKLFALTLSLALCTQTIPLFAQDQVKTQKVKSFSKRHPYFVNSLKIAGGIVAMAAGGSTLELGEIINDPELGQTALNVLNKNRGTIRTYQDMQNGTYFIALSAGLFGIYSIIDGILGIINAPTEEPKNQQN